MRFKSGQHFLVAKIKQKKHYIAAFSGHTQTLLKNHLQPQKTTIARNR